MTATKQKPSEAERPEVKQEAVPDEQPAGTDLVIRDPSDRDEVIAVVDRHDEAMIVQELQRRVLRVMLYQFPGSDGADVTDLSYLGVNEAVRVMNDSAKWRVTIDRDSLDVATVTEDVGSGDEPCWQATVYAVNANTGYGQFGTYTQPKRMKLSDQRKVNRRKSKGEYVDEQDRIADKFARQKCVNKAQRNALRIHIPEAIRQTLIAQYQGKPDSIRRIEVGAGATEIANLPAPLQDEHADEQRDQARALYDELREVNPLALLPAQYHAYMVRAEWSHEKLDEFIDYLASKIETESKGAENGR